MDTLSLNTKRVLISSSNGSTNNAMTDLNKNSRVKMSPYRTSQASRKTLKHHEVPQFCREPYILSGYRRLTGEMTIRQCVATLFTLHNESFNIWSHIIAALAIAVYACSIFFHHGVVGNPLIYPLMCFAIAVCLAFLASSLAHLFCCVSWSVKHICFYMDYLAISVFTFTAGLGFICYSRPLEDDAFTLHKHPSIFITTSLCLSVTNLFLSCISRHRYRRYRFLLRTGVYLIKYIFDISPFVLRCLTSSSTCDPVTVGFFKRHMLFYAISGFVNATRLPERLLPGHFDLIGYSHHIFHVLLAIGNFDAFNALALDMRNRREELLTSSFQPTFFSSFGLLILLMTINGSIVAWFISTWLTTEEHERFTGSKYTVIYRKTDQDGEHAKIQ